MTFAFAPSSSDAVPILLLDAKSWSAADQVWWRAPASAMGFEPKAGRHCLLPPGGGTPGAVLFGLGDAATPDPFAPGRLAALLPAGLYRFPADTANLEKAALGWALSSYRFTRYKRAVGDGPQLCAPDGVDCRRIERIAAATTLGRDLVNTPANDLGPETLEAAATAFAARIGAGCTVVSGEALADGFPLIHAVGLAGHQPPRLVDIVWGDPGAPAVTLVGKGVTFDTGGLNIKPETGMLLMKKDMGGAAAALALASMIADAGLRLRLRVLIPIVENAIGSASFRPGDVYRSRKGPTVEIGNTDAEGRLILADALALAGEEKPALLIDFATLTGAARVALGPDLAPFFTADDAMAAALAEQGRTSCDPVWRLPLWAPYDPLLDGKVGDIANVAGSPFGGSIMAALFLQRFVDADQRWIHFDIFGWNPTAKPGRPEGGEVQAARLLYDFLDQRYPA